MFEQPWYKILVYLMSLLQNLSPFTVLVPRWCEKHNAFSILSAIICLSFPLCWGSGQLRTVCMYRTIITNESNINEVPPQSNLDACQHLAKTTAVTAHNLQITHWPFILVCRTFISPGDLLGIQCKLCHSGDADRKMKTQTTIQTSSWCVNMSIKRPSSLKSCHWLNIPP